MRPNMCPHLEHNHCNLVKDLTDISCPVRPSICDACLSSDRPSRINLVTLTLASRLTPERNYDTTLLGNGFGTRLATLIAPFLSEIPSCKCSGHKDILDLWTPEYIEKNIDRVVQWLSTEARKRRVPFSYKVTRYLLKQLLKTM